MKVLFALIAVAVATLAHADSNTVDNNAVALSLYRQLAKAEGNLFFSPYSIREALAMTWGGARGQNADQMATTLNLSPQTHEKLAALRKQVVGDELLVANSLWPQKGYTFLPEYARLLKTQYGTVVTPLDFGRATEAARVQINGWVSEHTKTRIPELFAPGALDANTRLALVNAVYFKGMWAQPFDERRTQPGVFHLENGTAVQVPMMRKSTRYGYVETEALRAVELPYAGGKFSMVVILANPGHTDPDSRLGLQFLQELRTRDVELQLPRFSASSQFVLNNTLAAMGMPDAFDSNHADFSGMDGTRDLFISVVVHKAFVEVNEEGTEAAAATGAAFGVTSIPQYVSFHVDRPFLYLIRHKPSGTIVFMGREINPKKGI